MIKNKASIEVKIGENLYSMECAGNAALGEVHDALVLMKQEIVEMIAANHAKDSKKPDAEKQE
jgi:hypothetical protein